MMMGLEIPKQTMPPLEALRTTPEETLSTVSTSIAQTSFTIADARLNMPRIDPLRQKEIGLAAKEAMDEGFRYLEIGNLHGASVAFARMAELLPHSGSYALWGYTFLIGGDYLRAANIFEKAIKADPRDAHAQSLLGLAYSRLGKLPKSIRAFRQALRANPGDAGIHFYLGHLYTQLRQWRSAAQEYREAIRLKKDFLEAYQYLADLFLDRGRMNQAERAESFLQAINVYQELIDDNNDEELNNRVVAAAYNNIGVIYSELGNYGEALRTYEKAVVYDRDDVIGLTNIGFAYMDAKRFEDAKPIWKRLIEILEDDKQPKRVLLSQAYYNLGAAIINISSAQFMRTGTEDPEQVMAAQTAFEKSIAFDPQLIYPYIGLGITYTRQDRYEEAKEAFIKTLELDPHNVWARDNLRVMPLDEIFGTVRDKVEAAKRGDQVDADELANRVVEIYHKALKEQEMPAPIGTFTPDEMVGALLPIVMQMDDDLRFRFAAKLFERDLLSSGKAARLAGMDRVTFLLDLHKVGVAVIDLDEEQLESQARYVNSR
jgi:tetratricopeptide (TPR) repeat protein